MSRLPSGPRRQHAKADVVSIPFCSVRLTKDQARAKLLVVFAPTLVDGFLDTYSEYYRFHARALFDRFLLYTSAKQGVTNHSPAGIDVDMEQFKVMGAPI